MSGKIYKPVFASQARKLCLLGATTAQIADFFECHVNTVDNWIRDREDFRTAVQTGKMMADANVAQSLYRRAMGYSHREDDIKQYEGKVIITKTVKHYPPDTTACIFWLKNRQRKVWRDKHDVGLSPFVPIVIKGSDGRELMTLGAEQREQEDEGE